MGGPERGKKGERRGWGGNGGSWGGLGDSTAPLPPQGVSLLEVRAQALLQYLQDLALLLGTKARGGRLGGLPALPRLLETRLVRGGAAGRGRGGRRGYLPLGGGDLVFFGGGGRCGA